MSQQLEKIKELILKKYDADACGYTELRSEGNSTDVFQDGYDCGESSVLYEIGCILGLVLDEPAEQDYDY